MAELSVAKNELEEFKCSANDAIEFKLVRNVQDIDDEEKAFPPDMTHQVFGDSEMIFGYRGLKVSIYYTGSKLIPYLRISHSEVCNTKEHGVSPDDIEKLLAQELPPGYLTNLDTFKAALSDEATFKPFGEKIDSYTVTTKNGEERHFDVYFAKMEKSGFQKFHERIQSFIKFYIDAASYIDVDDPQWQYYFLFERYKEDGETRLAAAGYMTVYNFYAYPTHIRPRMSQVLVLTPFQRLGLGAKLVQTFYNTCYSRSDVLDITVEDPSDNFQRLRDFVDAQNCMKLKYFQLSELKKGFSHDMLHEAQTKLKLSKLQTRRMYEILRLKATDQSNKEEFREYRLDVKRRLNIPYMKTKRMFLKLENCLNPEEIAQTLGLVTKEQKFLTLENDFQTALAAYRRVLERLASS
ncbi:histone acetyltransferase type B catalytic subunit [Aplysia californica]|uniref:Histone acetyltransferase type B catalytic subunit n=1 Tax=Aplysia californica TaxID=6500 RepID=A0ABM0JYQ4_APLCA|nr:histone acetyltransferase type B catalytic subunit [Aplysia californica]